jgi:hypothetical protein
VRRLWDGGLVMLLVPSHDAMVFNPQNICLPGCSDKQIQRGRSAATFNITLYIH